MTLPENQKSQKDKVFLCVPLQTTVWLLLCFFWRNGFFLGEWPYIPGQYRTRFTVDDTLIKNK